MSTTSLWTTLEDYALDSDIPTDYYVSTTSLSTTLEDYALDSDVPTDYVSTTSFSTTLEGYALDDVMGASGSYNAGLVPTGNVAHSDKYLRKDGIWATPIDTDNDTQANWSTTNVASAAYILNKPTTTTSVTDGSVALVSSGAAFTWQS